MFTRNREFLDAVAARLAKIDPETPIATLRVGNVFYGVGLLLTKMADGRGVGAWVRNSRVVARDLPDQVSPALLRRLPAHTVGSCTSGPDHLAAELAVLLSGPLQQPPGQRGIFGALDPENR